MSIPRQRIKRDGKIDLWDMGPPRPTAPEPPKAPDLDKLKGADKALAEVQHEDAVEAHKGALRAYGSAKEHHRQWHETNGGPLKVELWAVDARHALEVEPDRFKLDLPKGHKPGAVQVAADEAAARLAEELDRARTSDPQFGQEPR